MACQVKFTDVGEWLEELELDAIEVRDGLIRVCILSEFAHPMVMRFLVAGAVVNGVLVELKHFIGETFPRHHDEDLDKRYDAARKRIIDAADKLGLKVRAGWFVESGATGGIRR